MSIPQMLNAAVAHHRAGRPEQARAGYSRVPEIEPNRPDALHLLGMLAQQEGKRAEAIDCYEEAPECFGRAIQFNPDFTAARLDRAFKAEGLGAANHITLLPRLSEAEFLGLHRKADVMLDSLYWAGGNTSMEGLEAFLEKATRP